MINKYKIVSANFFPSPIVLEILDFFSVFSLDRRVQYSNYDPWGQLWGFKGLNMTVFLKYKNSCRKRFFAVLKEC